MKVKGKIKGAKEREIDSQLLAVGRLMVSPLRSWREFSLRDLIPKRTASPRQVCRSCAQGT